MAGKAISLDQFKAALKAIRNSTISEPDLSVKFVENAPNFNAVEGEAGYILNRPFGVEIVDIFPETELELILFEDLGMTLATFNPSDNMTPGEEYTISYAGVEYKRTMNEFYAMGNTGLLDGSEDNGDPFIVIIFDEATTTYAVISCDGREAGSKVTLGIRGKKDIPIDPKYIPDSVKYWPIVDITNARQKGNPDYFFGITTKETLTAYLAIGVGITQEEYETIRERVKSEHINVVFQSVWVDGYIDPFTGETTHHSNSGAITIPMVRIKNNNNNPNEEIYLYQGFFGAASVAFLEFDFPGGTMRSRIRNLNIDIPE